MKDLILDSKGLSTITYDEVMDNLNENFILGISPTDSIFSIDTCGNVLDILDDGIRYNYRGGDYFSKEFAKECKLVKVFPLEERKEVIQFLITLLQEEMKK